MNMFNALAQATPEIQDLALVWPLVFLLKLPKGANIVVAGAYRGRVMELLATVYPEYGNIVGFEPQDDARAFALERLKKYKNVTIEPYGIGTTYGTFPMGEYGAEYAGFLNLDPAASRTSAKGHGQGQIKEASHTFRELGLNKIDFMLLNMEGYEFILIPHLLDNGWFERGAIERLAVQIHWGMGHDNEYGDMIRRLERTHKRVFDEIPSWGYWQYSG